MRLIDADNIEPHEHLESFCNNHAEYTMVAYMDDINALPTVDAVPVVRCRNCRFSQRINEWVYECYVWNDDRMFNQYCDMGERKDGDGNG